MNEGTFSISNSRHNKYINKFGIHIFCKILVKREILSRFCRTGNLVVVFCFVFTEIVLFRFGPYFAEPLIVALKDDGSTYMCGKRTTKLYKALVLIQLGSRELLNFKI